MVFRLSAFSFPVKITLSIFFGLLCWFVVRQFIFIEQVVYWLGIVDVITSSLQWIVVASLNSIGIVAKSTHNIITIEGAGGMRIVYGCLAISHIALFTGLIIAYPQKSLYKLWYIPAGIILLHVLNAVRLIGIGIVLNYMPTWGEFAHYYLTRFVMYGGVLFLWLFFILRICRK